MDKNITPEDYPVKPNGTIDWEKSADFWKKHNDTPREDEKLVTSSISHREENLEIYPVSLKVKRPAPKNPNQIIFDRTETTITGFSSKSRARLRHTSVNAFPALISQFGLTYHNEWPTDGRECKRHLDNWLKTVRRLLPDAGYLWIMEFQKRDAPHFHVFLTVEPNETLRGLLADAWCRLTSPDDEQALAFHRNEKNWINWDMGNGNYLCKYLDKEAQKCIPDGYHNFGRFWGNSRNLVKDPITVPLDNLDHLSTVDEETGEELSGEKTVIRWLGRLAEKQTNGYSRFRKRAPNGSYTMLQGTPAYLQIERYLSKLQRSNQQPKKLRPHLP